MKSPVAYYLVLLYATVMFKPLIPVFSDVWSHEFNEIEHITVVHAKYGSHHLQKEVAESGSDSNQKNQNSLKSEDQVPFHIVVGEYRCSYNKAAVQKQFIVFLHKKISPISVFKKGPPPKFS